VPVNCLACPKGFADGRSGRAFFWMLFFSACTALLR
jgi:hypothetical protein